MKRMMTIPKISRQKLQFAAKDLICSLSGWRKVFAPGMESRRKTLSPENKVLVMLAAQSFYYLLQNTSRGIACGRDTRPTSKPIQEIMEAVFHSQKLSLHSLNVCPSPEISSYVRVSSLEGFCYITASHNPIGYSGIKFGNENGGILSLDKARTLVQIFRKLIDEYSGKKILLSRPKPSLTYKKTAEEIYFEQLKSVSLGAASPEKSKNPIKIVVDMNGSARTKSIDEKWAKYLGIQFHMLNNKPGKIAHTIIPEAEALNDCKKVLEIMNRKDPFFQLGYMYDNDGDRGNLLIINPLSHRAQSTSTQQYFALLCLCELLWERHGNNTHKQAIVVNDATSYRIDEIARQLGAKVFRTEVGESNLLKKTEELKEQGFHVRVAGEGSTAGCIISPAKIRDPLLALTAIYKAYAFNLFAPWFQISGHSYTPDPPLNEVLDSLPKFTTTVSSEERAILHLQSDNTAALKRAYEKIFLQQYPQYEHILASQLGVDSWEQENSCHHKIIKGPEGWKEHPPGGLSIKFKKQEKVMAFIWFRRSGTEPLYRILVDVKGSRTSLERILLEWQRQMLILADGEVIRNN